MCGGAGEGGGEVARREEVEIVNNTGDFYHSGVVRGVRGVRGSTPRTTSLVLLEQRSVISIIVVLTLQRQTSASPFFTVTAMAVYSSLFPV